METGEAADGEVEDYQVTIDPPSAASGIFAPKKIIDQGGNGLDLDDPTSVFATDLDRDGDMDVLGAAYDADRKSG